MQYSLLYRGGLLAHKKGKEMNDDSYGYERYHRAVSGLVMRLNKGC
jgi:hypothetical protein